MALCLLHDRALIRIPKPNDRAFGATRQIDDLLDALDKARPNFLLVLLMAIRASLLLNLLIHLHQQSCLFLSLLDVKHLGQLLRLFRLFVEIDALVAVPGKLLLDLEAVQPAAGSGLLRLLIVQQLLLSMECIPLVSCHFENLLRRKPGVVLHQLWAIENHEFWKGYPLGHCALSS